MQNGVGVPSVLHRRPRGRANPEHPVGAEDELGLQVDGHADFAGRDGADAHVKRHCIDVPGLARGDGLDAEKHVFAHLHSRLCRQGGLRERNVWLRGIVSCCC